MRMAKSTEGGAIWVNCYDKITHQPFLGESKESAIGKDLGEDFLSGFTTCKSTRGML
ncbi:hypothetical protein BJ166DRAFT_510201 [Pestalotiopsis sp. NC0098]|nr:hypothetical protein BJ166DRAFT_510201 [Pestalotiopsis sp. NC0098]